MPKNTRLVIALCCLVPALFTACRRETASRTTCASTIHGITGTFSDPYIAQPTNPYALTHGVINLTTGAMATSGTFSGYGFAKQRGTYNSSDNCYYVFGSTGVYPTYSRYLYRIAAGGATTAYLGPDTTLYAGLIFNPSNSKMYCTRSGNLEEITISGTTFSTAVVATPTHSIVEPFPNSSYSSITVNRSTGDLYFISHDISGNYLEKYHPGSTGTTALLLGVDINYLPFELRYNQNDNMLYAIKTTTLTNNCDFLKIDPSTGSNVIVAHTGISMPIEVLCGTLDECTNRYLLSIGTRNVTGGVTIWRSIFHQLDMSGTILQRDTVATIYQGLDVQY